MYIKHGSNKHARRRVEWKDGKTSWECLTDIKESNPVEVYEYAISNNFHDAPDFVWWVPYVLKKSINSIADVTNRYHKRTRMFGIEVPKSWDDCAILDMNNGNTMWQYVVRKEIKDFRVAFNILNGGEVITKTYQ
jgi:hypothetical protein